MNSTKRIRPIWPGTYRSGSQRTPVTRIRTGGFLALLLAGALSVSAAATAAGDADPLPFLPAVSAKGTSPTITRDGVKIPLRPEMLPVTMEPVRIPAATRDSLSNGMRLFTCESRGLPSVYYVVLLRAGSILDPAGRCGLAELTAETLRAGGTATTPPDEFDRRLDQIGSRLEVTAERDFVRIQMFALAEKREDAAALLADLLLHPAFAADRFEKERKLKLEEIRRQDDEPADLARREFRKFLYGADHPLGRTPTTATVSTVTRDDVVRFYEAHYAPANCWFGAAGDIGAGEASEIARRHYGSWERKAAVQPPLPPVTEPAAGGPLVRLVPKDTAQSQIRIGHLGMARNSPEQYAAAVLSSIYGMGGFSSRLMMEVRTRRGYAYSVGGGFVDDNPRGVFFAVASSKAATTGAALAGMIGVTTSTLKGGVTPDELRTAKRDVVQFFATRFDVPREVVYQRMLHDLQGYPPDFVDTFASRVEAVTASDVERVAREWIHPGRLRILVVGNAAAMDMPMDRFGQMDMAGAGAGKSR